ncbi:MAG: helix-turn-helix domain-containing protein [Acidimicrobiia bacterium]|nr:helix-turn-helix domain-containing protein [Acidimicrobiia bacterium]MDH3463912.1 helix-turn-helix domain-containing protein [Acidimicrobiia bacterium]
MPPEMSFGRSVRYRRTRLGLSQTRLGELVGRSAAAVRSWERETSIPSDPSVLQALAAVLGIETDVLFSKAGIEAPEVETSPTVEQALETLAPPKPEGSVNSGQEGLFDALQDRRGVGAEEDSGELISVGYTPIPPSGHAASVATAPGLTAPTGQYVLTVPAPPVIEPSYMEDESQRQMYRIRNLATLVLGVGLLVALIWAFGNGWQELNDWWDRFSSLLRL